MKNGKLVDVTAKFLGIGTSEIRLWAGDDAVPFVVSMDTKSDFDASGFNYEDYSDMEVGEVRKDGDFEGIIVIKIK